MSILQKMSVLVTGGAGYIGSHAVLALLEKGFRVTVVDTLERGNAEFFQSLEGVRLVEGNVGDRSLMRRVFSECGIDAVMHFAAYAYVGESVREPGLYYHNNVANLIALLDETVRAGVRCFVFSSSCATYGVPEQMPITESCRQNPVNPYGMSKLMAEQILRDCDSAYGLKSVVFRYFNAAGADPAGRAGERHDPETHLIPLALQAAAGLRPHLSVYGEDWPTPDGTCVRDYIHVSDVADAHLRGLDFLLNCNRSGVFNLSNGQGFSVRQVIETVEQVTGLPVPVEFAGRRAGDPASLIGCAGKARQVLGWQPRYRDLAGMVRHAWQWQER
jgi:UDP-glucose 4-epimerase